MYKNLLEAARSEGIQQFIVEALIKNQNQVLLVEDPVSQHYEFPSSPLKDGESLQQALQRLVIEKTSMVMSDVKAFFTHYDVKKETLTRHFQFIVEVSDPFAIQLSGYAAYAWVDVQEGVGYPITDLLREQLDTFALLP